MNKLLLSFIVIAVYKILSNGYYYLRIKYLSQLHLKWLSNKAPNFPTYKSEIISLFKKAGVKNISIPTTQALGYSKVASFNADIFTNFPNTHPDISGGAIRLFYEAEGVYRQRIFETFSPVYWVDIIIFAPRRLLAYLGFDEDKTLFKACNVLLTAIWWVLATIFVFFKPQIKELVIELLREL